MSEPSNRECKPCHGVILPVSNSRQVELLQQLVGWEIVDNHHLVRSFIFPDFAKALGFVNRVGVIAEKENHHPDVYLTWGKVRIEIWTHAIDALTENDFILATKIDSSV